jgi:HD superfamily phosphodiesterase
MDARSPLHILPFVEEKTRHRDPSHGAEHMQDVGVIASNIALDYIQKKVTIIKGVEQPLALDIVLFAAFIHDLVDHKYNDVSEAEVDEELEMYLNEQYRSYVWAIVKNMSYSKEKCEGYPHHLGKLQTVRDIVSDADKITALGEEGLKRARETLHHLNPGKTFTPEEEDALIAKHMEEKLLLLKDHYIRTEKGKELAQEGHDIMQEWYNKHKNKC